MEDVDPAHSGEDSNVPFPALRDSGGKSALTSEKLM